MTTRYLVYSRVSTDDQERNGTSLVSQGEACVAYGSEQGWRLLTVVRDTASGAILDRPGLDRVRRHVRDGDVDAVVVYDPDRLSRDLLQMAALLAEAHEYSVRIAFVTEPHQDSTIGHLILMLRSYVAEVEREKIAERTLRGKIQRARSGHLPQGTGNGLYGYDYHRGSGLRTAHPAQAPVVQRIFLAYDAGASCHGIARQLDEDGIPTLTGGRWHPLTVRRVLTNRAYTGHTVFRQTETRAVRDPHTGRVRRRVVAREPAAQIVIPGATPSIIADDLFARVQQRLADAAKRRQGRPTRKYPLRQHVRCLTCNTPMVGQVLGGGRYRYYRCRASYAGTVEPTCRSRYVPAEALEHAVLDAILRDLAHPDRVADEWARLREDRALVDEVADLERQRQDLDERERRLARLYLNGGVPEAVLDVESNRLHAARERITHGLAACHATASAAAQEMATWGDPAQLGEALRRFVLEDLDRFRQLLAAYRIEVRAGRDRVEISGVLAPLNTVGHVAG